MAQQKQYGPMRAPNVGVPVTNSPNSQSTLSANAVEFVPKAKTIMLPPDPLMYQPAASHVHQRFAMAQGGGDGSGGGGGGAGGGYEYATPMTLQNRLSNMQIVDGGDNGKEFNHHHHQQPPMHHQHHQQYRGQQQQHHGYHHHHQQQQHQAYGSYGYQNNHAQQGGMGGDHRKYHNGGQQQQQQQQHHNHHRSRQQHQHHHQQPHHQQQQQYGGNHHQGWMGGGTGPVAAAGYNNVSAPNWDSNFQEDNEQISYRQTQAMDYLTGVIAELFDNPGLFDDSIMTKLPKKLGDMRQDHYVLSSTIEMIFEQSIRESNFRYMGARLCKLLDSLNNGPNLALRELLQLKMEDQSGELPQFMKNEQVKVRGATLFLAELYMQLRDPQQPFGKTISEHIINAIEILLAKEGPENTKCVCQCLKLCGYELEQDCPEKVESILHKLQSQTNVQSSTEAMIRSVFTLRKNAWGRSEEPAAPIPPMPVPTDAMLMGGGGAAVARNSPVFYGPDGKVLTEEEHSFLSTNVEEGKNPNAYNDYDDDDEYGLVDPNEDLEIQEAYEDFIQSSGQNQQQQQYRPNV